MCLTDEDSADRTKQYHLHTLPSTVLYEVTKNLDVSSQRSLFLASLQLYKTWHLQLSEEDHEWQFLNWSLDVLAQISSQSGCDMRIEIDAYFSDTDHQAKILCSGKQHNCFGAILFFNDKHSYRSLWIPVYCNQGSLTKEQVLKRCISRPGLDGSSIAFTLKHTTNQQELRALAHHFFSLVHKHKGYVVFRFARRANLLVTHLQYGWKINLKPCSVSPSVLDLTTCTEEGSELVGVWGKLYSRGTLASHSLLDISSNTWVISKHKWRSPKP